MEKEVFATVLQQEIDISEQAKKTCPTNKVYHKEMLEKNIIKWTEDGYCEDKLFAIQAIYYTNGVVAVPNENYYYYRNPNSTVNSRAKNLTKDKNNARLSVLKFLKDKKMQIRDCYFEVIKKQFIELKEWYCG